MTGSTPSTFRSVSTDGNGSPGADRRRLGVKLSHKISLLVVAMALASGTVVAVADYRQAAAELRESVEAKLSSLLDSRRAAIIDYLASIRRDLRSQAVNPFVLEAYNSFVVGWDELGENASSRLHDLYITDNPVPAGRRQTLDHPNDPSIYSLAHNRFHPQLRQFVEHYGYRDLILIDPNGTVVYSVMKQGDFATSVLEQPDASGGLGRAFDRVINSDSPDTDIFVDFTFYQPAQGRPTGFVARPLVGETGSVIGVLIFEMPVDRINSVMNVDAGMGETGETFIAGRDLRMRSDSRFSDESTILSRIVDFAPVKRALNGEQAVMVSTEVTSDGDEVELLSAFAPLDFLETRWAIVATADLTEVYAPIGRMRDRAILHGLLLMLLVAAVGYGLTRFMVAGPMAAVTGAVRKLSQGNRDAEIPWVERGDEIGDVARALVLFRDSLREHDRLETARAREARETEALLRLSEAIEAISEGFILLDAQDKVVLTNSKYREIYRKSAHLLSPGADFEAFLRHHAEIGEIVEAQGRVEEFLVDRLERMNPGDTVESRLTDGHWLQISDYRMEDGGIVSVCTDITDLKRREDALAESEQRYRLLVDTLPDGVLLHDSRNMLFLNSVGRRILGLTEDDPVEKYHYREFVHQGEKAASERRIQAIIERGEENPPAERRIHTKDGRDIWIEIAAVPFRRGGRQLALAVFRDLTEAKQAEAEIERQREALHQSEKLSALGSLLAGVAHELNNPLSVVVAQAVLMEETNRDPKIVKRAEDIRMAAERCARIVKTFLSMARQQQPELGSVDLNTLVGNALELMAYSLRTAGVEVAQDLADDLPAIWGDADQLHQVVANLVVNAQQAMMDTQETRRLTVSTRSIPADGMVRLLIDDTGPGVPADLRSRIFDPFYTTKPTGVGTGIGLSVCHGVVESHGGRISLVEAPGGGARFIIDLPSTRAADRQPLTESTVVKDSGGRRILVVDDEPEIAETLAEILELDGHVVDLADGGNSALQRIANSDYDLILTDLRMPSLDGPGLFRELEKRYPHLCSRVVVITGDTLQATASDFLKETGLPLIEKPFIPGDVSRVVSEALSQQ